MFKLKSSFLIGLTTLFCFVANAQVDKKENLQIINNTSGVGL